MKYWMAGVYDDSLINNANIRGGEVENGEEGEIFTVPGVKEYNF